MTLICPSLELAVLTVIAVTGNYAVIFTDYGSSNAAAII
jgi:hypothetical protein